MKTTLTAAIMVGLLLTGAARASEHPEHPKAKAEAASPGAGALDGKVFVGELVKDGQSAGDKDKLSFNKGTFVSTACVPHGFQDAQGTDSVGVGSVFGSFETHLYMRHGTEVIDLIRLYFLYDPDDTCVSTTPMFCKVHK